MSVSEEVTLEIPPQLKSRMEDDCFWIIRRKKVIGWKGVKIGQTTPSLEHTPTQIVILGVATESGT